MIHFFFFQRWRRSSFFAILAAVNYDETFFSFVRSGGRDSPLLVLQRRHIRVALAASKVSVVLSWIV